MGDNLKPGKKSLIETVNRIKSENQQEEEQELAVKEEVRNELAALHDNSDLAAMYKESANLGAKNLVGELPLLKVHATNKSKGNELADGSEPHDGWFFYKPSAEEFETIDCHILTISRGFRAEGMENRDGTKKEVYNQIVGGLLKDGTDYKPFIMYFTGMKLSYLWEFAKIAAKYTRAKPVPIPMFALTVRLSTTKKENAYGKSSVVLFDVVKNEDGSPKIVLDPGEFQFLKDSVEQIEDTISSLIETKTITQVEEVEPIHSVSEEVPDYPELDTQAKQDNLDF